MKRNLLTILSILLLMQFCAGVVFGVISNSAEIDPEEDYVSDEVLVILSADINQNKRLDAAENLIGVEENINGNIIRTRKASRTKEIALVKLQKGKTVKQAILEDWPKKDSRILHVEPNYRVYADAVPNDPRYSELWGLNNTGQTGGAVDADIDAPEAWDITTGSSDVIIAVIDSGVDCNHPDLSSNMWINSAEIPDNGIDDDLNGYIDDIYGYDFFQDDPDPSDGDSHGTHCAGTIAAAGNNALGVVGVNWQCRIMACRFLNASGSGSSSDAIDAIYYAVDNGATVLSNSWGGGGYSEAMKLAIEYARDHGVLFVAAAGNSASNNDEIPHYPSSYDVSNVVAVANTTHLDQLSSLSCYGKQSVHLGAPGSGILSTVPAYEVLFEEDFEGASDPNFTGTQMLVDGTANWVAIDSTVNVPNKAARTDPNTYPYGSNSDGSILTPPLDTRGLRGLSVSFNYRYEIGPGDELTMDVWDGSAWHNLFSRSSQMLNSYYFIITLDIPEQYRNAAMQLRFRWVSDTVDNSYYGAEIDNIRIKYIGADYTNAYASKSGTSMATPHVSGVAGLVQTLYPTTSLYELKSRLLMGDPIPALTDTTLSGRRLNAYSALTASGIILVSPNGGDRLLRGYTFPINWLSVDANATVDIYLYKGGIVYDTVASSVSNTGSYSWDIPADLTLGSDYTILIDDGTGLSDESDAYFEIGDPLPYFTELFVGSTDTFDLANKSVLFTPAGDDYTACIQTATALPTDPSGGTTLGLGDDGYATVIPGSSILFYGNVYPYFYVGSNGYITFEGGDYDFSESIDDHLSMKRISGLFDDLYPPSGGTISWKQTADCVAVTWDSVPEIGTSNENTFQIEMFTDGRIQITWLDIAATDGLVGLSRGSGMGPDFVEEDFSLLAVCDDTPPSEEVLIFQEDFEDGPGGFVIDNTFGNGNGLWHLTALCNAALTGHSETTALFYGIDNTCNYDGGLTQGVVTSPPISLNGFSTGPIQLKLKYFLHTEGAPSSYDKASVEISDNGGAFVPVAHNDGAAAPVVLTDPSTSWLEAAVDLSAYAGSTIQVRFGFNTVDGSVNSYPGFYVDDVTVYGPPCNYLLLGDLNTDCKINMVDFGLMAENWLVNCYLEPANPACVAK